jgi:choline dehydrogenase-like flavoprotein
VAIVGSGFGGAVSAYSFTQAGFDTIVVERGEWTARDDQDWDARQILVEMRYAGPSSIAVTQYGRKIKQQAQNEVVGGGSIFFGGAALRLRRKDFASWPIGYDVLEQHYCRAEQLLEIHGEAGTDPFEPERSCDYPYRSLPLTGPAERIHRAATKLGFRPFVMPLAINHHNSSRSVCEKCVTCDGFPCKICAKNDVATTALQKADRSHLTVLTGVVAKHFKCSSGRAVSLECIDKAGREPLVINAKTYVVSAGAIESPALLLRSQLDHLDESNALGRYLMRHCNAIVGCWFPRKINPEATNHKQVCITDFYEDMREELSSSVGIIQDMMMPPPDGSRYMAPRGLGNIAAFFNRYIQCLLCIAEDKPQEQNRVFLEPVEDELGLPRLRLHHEYCIEDMRRRNYLVKRAKKILRKAGGWIRVVQKIDSFSHVVGTLRFGSSPDNSVLDANCRFYPLENLYVVDGSFMPSSGGVNPSLTIAANALRVSEHVIKSFR